MFESAHGRFLLTEEGRSLQEHFDQLERKSADRLGFQDRQILEHCLEALSDLDSAEMEYLYRQGYRDCIALLKALQVL